MPFPVLKPYWKQGITEMNCLPMIRARRNMADWLKILKQTPLFTLSLEGDNLALSSFSIKENRLNF